MELMGEKTFGPEAKVLPGTTAAKTAGNQTHCASLVFSLSLILLWWTEIVLKKNLTVFITVDGWTHKNNASLNLKVSI